MITAVASHNVQIDFIAEDQSLHILFEVMTAAWGVDQEEDGEDSALDPDRYPELENEGDGDSAEVLAETAAESPAEISAVSPPEISAVSPPEILAEAPEPVVEIPSAVPTDAGLDDEIAAVQWQLQILQNLGSNINIQLLSYSRPVTSLASP